MCICVSEFAFFCIYIFSFEYNLLNFLLICNVHACISFPYSIYSLSRVYSKLPEWNFYGLCNLSMSLTRVNNKCMSQEKRQVERETVFVYLTMHKHANYSYKTMWSTIYYESQKRLKHVEILFLIFWQINKNLLNQLRVFFIFFITYTRVGFVKFSRSIKSLVM